MIHLQRAFHISEVVIQCLRFGLFAVTVALQQLFEGVEQVATHGE